MKLAIIVPTPSKLQVPFSGYQMALAQKVAEGGDYGHWFKRASKQHCFIILDNGEAEGEQMPFTEVLKVANSINADEVILPDAMRNAEKTISMISDPAVLNRVPVKNRMVVLQGSDWTEVDWFLFELRRLNIQFATLGIPKHLERLNGGRVMALDRVAKYYDLTTINLHLLGIYAKPMLEVSLALDYCKHIRGVDTAAPIAYAQNNSFIRDNAHFSVQWNKPVTHTQAINNCVQYSDFVHSCNGVKYDFTETSVR
jgi:hypothetical protein